MLAADLGATLLMEDPAQNPFLPLFYENPEQHAFQTQVFFLLSRYRKQMEIKQPHLFNQVTITDFVFAKDRIFAALNLTDHERELYQSIYDLLNAQLTKPDLVLFLQASPEVLMTRIRKRNAPYEKGITQDYVTELSAAYSQFFFQYDEAPVLTVNTSGLDFVHRPEDYDLLKKELVSMWEKGKKRHQLIIDHR
jgi:deoxyadenosine/deoxycytidine kinase